MAELTITDPHYKGRVLVIHADLTGDDAGVLASIYRALGYPDRCVVLEVEEDVAVAA